MVIQKTAKATGDTIGNNIAEKIAKAATKNCYNYNKM